MNVRSVVLLKMTKRNKADQLRSTLNLLATLRKLDVTERRYVLNHLDKKGVLAIRTCLVNCLDKNNCHSHLAELLKPHVVDKKKTLSYLTENKVRPTKLNRAKIAELGEALSPLLDVSILSMAHHIKELTQRAAKVKTTCALAAKNKECKKK